MNDMKQQSQFMQFWNGPFKGVLSWKELDKTWDYVQQQGLWYVYPTDQAAPNKPASKQELNDFIKMIDQTINPKKQQGFSGVAFVDDRESPQLIKVFNPKLLGCGSGQCDAKPLPHWIISSMRPDDLKAQTQQTKKQAFWKRLFN